MAFHYATADCCLGLRKRHDLSCGGGAPATRSASASTLDISYGIHCTMRGVCTAGAPLANCSLFFFSFTRGTHHQRVLSVGLRTSVVDRTEQQILVICSAVCMPLKLPLP